GDQHVHLEPYQFCCEAREALVLVVGKAPIDDQILAFDPATVAQPSAQLLDTCCVSGLRSGQKTADARCPRPGLCLGARKRDEHACCKRPRDEIRSRCAKECSPIHELPHRYLKISDST